MYLEDSLKSPDGDVSLSDLWLLGLWPFPAEFRHERDSARNFHIPTKYNGTYSATQSSICIVPMTKLPTLHTAVIC